jgi:hypothetical protein
LTLGNPETAGTAATSSLSGAPSRLLIPVYELTGYPITNG